MDHRVPKVGLVLALVCSALAADQLRRAQRGVRGPERRSASSAASRTSSRRRFDDTEGLPTKQPVLVRGVAGRQGDRGRLRPRDLEGDRHVHRRRRARRRPRRRDGDDRRAHPARRSVPQPRPGHRGRAGARVRRRACGRCRASTSTRRSTSSTATAAATSARPIDTLDEATRLGALGRAAQRHHRRARADGLRGARPHRRAAGPGGGDRRLRRRHRDRGRRRARQPRGGAAPDRRAPGRATLDALATNTASLEQGGRGAARRALDSGTEALRARPSRCCARRSRWSPSCARPRPTSRRRSPTSARSPSDTVRDGQGRLRAAVAAQAAARGRSSAARRCPGSRRRFATSSRCCATRRRARKGIVSFFSNFASVTAHGDADGAWARFAILFEPGEVADEPAARHAATRRTTCPRTPASATTPTRSPATPLDPEPYEPGSYPRLKPYDPPPPKSESRRLLANVPIRVGMLTLRGDARRHRLRREHDGRAGRGSTPPSAAARSSRRRGGCSPSATTAPSRPPTSPPRPGSRAASSTTTSAASASSTSRSCARCSSCRRASSPTEIASGDPETALGAAVDRWLDVTERSGGVLLAAHGAQGFGRDAEIEAIFDEARERTADAGDRDPAPGRAAGGGAGRAARRGPRLRRLRRGGDLRLAARRAAQRAQLRELLVGGLLALDREVVPDSWRRAR